MFAALKKALADALTAELGTGKLLEGVQGIQRGPVVSASEPTVLHPYVSVYVPSGQYVGAQGGARVDIDAELAVELYTQSMASHGDAEDECLRLLLSDDATQGLLVALDRVRLQLPGGQHFRLSRGEKWQARYGGGAQDGFTFAARVPLALRTMMARP